MTAPDLSGVRWVKSTHSNNGGNCVEWAPGLPGIAPVRDSKDPEGPKLIFSTTSWVAFTAAVAAGEFGTV